ncbi:penicillin-binding transpeptidase domain-containing protein [Clostridiaceae bacterium 35-E11]
MESRMERKKKQQQQQSIINKENKYRVFFIAFTFTAFIFVLIGRLAYIQLIQGHEYYLRAKTQWFKEIPTRVERGKIYDRNMIPLTNKYKKSHVIVFPEYFNSTTENLQLLHDMTEITIHELKYEKLNSNRPVEMKIVNENEELIQKVVNMQGAFVLDYSDRYDEKGIASHVIGYINKVDNIGEKGLEKKYDQELKENQQYKIGAIVDAKKRMIPGLGYTVLENALATEKKNIVTTLDYSIQQIIEEEFDKVFKKGSIVVLDVKQGELLGMVSRPNFEQSNVAAYLENKNKELYNRAIQITYPPGSIFKIIVTAAALEYGIVDMEDMFFCNGYEEIGDIAIKCSSFHKGGHGKISLTEAFSKSCNSVFIQLGQKIGSKNIIDMAQKFGLGSLTEIGLLEEVPGHLPSEDYMKGAGIGNISIGQGTLEVTPLQIARLTAIIANNGIDNGVSLAKKIIDDEGNIIKSYKRKVPKFVINIGTAKIIQAMMETAVNEGTAIKAKSQEIGGAAGKTGSSEAIIDGEKTVHAWFTGYFPIDAPQYVITIIVENGGSGGKAAAPLFKKIAQRINSLNKH